MTTFVVATTNQGKLREFRQLLPAQVDVVSLNDLGMDAPDETGTTFLENATLKARHASLTGYPAIADDSGLIVDALDGMPGVCSSRFAGESASDAQNNQLLLERLAGTESGHRTARFHAAVVLIDSSGNCFSGEDCINGVIGFEPRGVNGFGYDSLFEIKDEGASRFSGKTMAQLTADQKAAISHRSRAYNRLVRSLKRRSWLAPELRPLVIHDNGDEHS